MKMRSFLVNGNCTQGTDHKSVAISYSRKCFGNGENDLYVYDVHVQERVTLSGKVVDLGPLRKFKVSFDINLTQE